MFGLFLYRGENMSKKAQPAIPYAYYYPVPNFTTGPDQYGESQYIENFQHGFSVPFDADKDLDAVITDLSGKEQTLLSVLKDNNVLVVPPDERGFFEILDPSQVDEEKDNGSLEANINALNRAIEKSVNMKTDIDLSKPLGQAAQNIMSKMIAEYFSNAPSIDWNDSQNVLFSPENIYSFLDDKTKQTIEQKNKIVDVTIINLLQNLKKWYDKHPMMKTDPKELARFTAIKDYIAYYNRYSGKKARAANSDLVGLGTNIDFRSILWKMARSIKGQIQEEKGRGVEESYGKLMKETFSDNDWQAIMSGKVVRKNKKYSAQVEMPKIPELNNEEIDQRLLALKNTLNDKAYQTRNPKADLTIRNKKLKQTLGISIKAGSLYLPNQASHDIALHHGTYISLIRYLMRYQGGINLASQLADPAVEHAVLNLTLAGEVVQSESLNEAAASLAYIFIGAGDNQKVLTQYGREVFKATKGSNSIVAFADGSGHCRLISGFLKEIRENLANAKMRVEFKLEKRPDFRYGGAAPAGYEGYKTVQTFQRNEAKASNFSSIAAHIYMKSFNK